MLIQKPFYIMRHGQTTDNAAGLISGAGSDPDLTDLGRAQAEAAYAIYQHLDPMPLTVIASGLRRTHETARLATQRVDFIIDPDLNERHLGELDGKISEAEQKARQPLPGEESSADHRTRVLTALNRHLQQDEVPLFICHGGTVRRALELAEVEVPEKIGNAEIYRLHPEGLVWHMIRTGS